MAAVGLSRNGPHLPAGQALPARAPAVRRLPVLWPRSLGPGRGGPGWWGQSWGSAQIPAPWQVASPRPAQRPRGGAPLGLQLLPLGEARGQPLPVPRLKPGGPLPSVLLEHRVDLCVCANVRAVVHM